MHNLPPVVFVKYPGATWVLPGLSEPGLYPITPRISKWYLDSGRNYPMLKISRRQLPLAPAFAMTAYACQGTTLPAAIVDMQSGRGSYVALTRTETREDLLIYRPFDLDLFTQGEPDGPMLLLKTLRGEYIDWAAIEAKHTPSHMCTGCGLRCFKEEFQPSQWVRKDCVHYCKGCVHAKIQAGTSGMHHRLWPMESKGSVHRKATEKDHPQNLHRL